MDQAQVKQEELLLEMKAERLIKRSGTRHAPLLLDPAESGESLQALLDRCRLPASNATRQAFQSLYGLTPSALRRQGHSPSPSQSLAELV